MKLDQAQELYTDYMEGTLSPAMRLALEQHFERDAEAREDYKAFRLIVASFEKVQPLELDPPSGFRASILERVTSEQAAASKQQSFSFADTLRDWFGGSQLRRMGSVGIATVAVAAVVFAGFHGHSNGNGPAPYTGTFGVTLPSNSVNTTVLGVSMKSGDDGNQYHLFRVHLPASIPEATVNAEVLSDPSQITDTAARSAQARPALKQSVDLTNDEELQIPVALLQAVPADATITLLVQWQPTDSQPAGEQVVFTPANPDATGTAVPVSPDSSESFYNALQFISSAYHVTVISDTSAAPDLTVNGWSATTQPADAVNAVAAATGYKVRLVDSQTYQFYK